MSEQEFSQAHKWIFIAFSGGKDSVASYLKTIEQYPKHIVKCIFSETGDEHPETYEFVRWFDANIHEVIRLGSRIKLEKNGRRYFENVRLSWDVPIAEIRKRVHTVYDEIRWRYSRYPDKPPYASGNARHCTRTLKVRSFQRYIRDLIPLSQRHLACAVIGLRRSESENRSNTPDTAIEIEGGWDIWYPIVDYSALDTFRAMYKAGIQFPQVYRYSKRSNCIGCPFASDKSIRAACERHGKEIIQEWVDIEIETGWTWKSRISIADAGKPLVEPKLTDLPLFEYLESCTSGFCEI